MKVRLLLSVILSALSLTFLEGLTNILFEEPSDLRFYLWNLLSMFFISAALGYYIIHNWYSSYRLWLFTFIILYVIGNFNIQVEALIFNVTDQTQTINHLLRGIPICAIGSFLLVYLFGRWETSELVVPKFMFRKVHHWIGKILAGNFLYFFFYLLAGMLMQHFTPRFNDIQIMLCIVSGQTKSWQKYFTTYQLLNLIF